MPFALPPPPCIPLQLAAFLSLPLHKCELLNSFCTSVLLYERKLKKLKNGGKRGPCYKWFFKRKKHYIKYYYM
jgi:hypothetical protein